MTARPVDTGANKRMTDVAGGRLRGSVSQCWTRPQDDSVTQSVRPWWSQCRDPEGVAVGDVTDRVFGGA